jgi:hypothetical protein
MYKPGRDGRFYYLWEVANFIEENQCKGCAFSKLQDPDESHEHAKEYPMCYTVEGKLIAEEPVEELDDRGNDGIVCNVFRSLDEQEHLDIVAEQSHPNQGRLFE